MGLEGSAEGEVVSERKHLCEDGKIRCVSFVLHDEVKPPMKRIDVPMRQRFSTECNRYPHSQLHVRHDQYTVSKAAKPKTQTHYTSLVDIDTRAR